MGFFDKLKEGLRKTKNTITERIDKVLVSFGKIDEELFEELEEILITSDVGIDTSMKIIENLKTRVKETRTTDPAKVKELLKEELAKILSRESRSSSSIQLQVSYWWLE
ncbi:signal recognition particle receptor protein FtsY [Acetivibrio straminisolvens JCM 21531]|uniref:Signal recognition particle receptor protein FtsY n=1 Tax=Acetivibrio straminisolvens JCM 21531 TaxID=1294263 RepID=W4V7M8_9FIRM|nr:signal recognition particle receptor protein FtsY [Acetivibrio straminisolvens JCM 21531]